EPTPPLAGSRRDVPRGPNTLHRMASRKRPTTRTAAPQTTTAPEGINPKAPCSCGSGRRYKHCHGSGYAPPV
ncbi:MAG: hypothetical protein AVDCRST_MAG52-2677, partial [uncultured Blastococcus sp.]